MKLTGDRGRAYAKLLGSTYEMTCSYKTTENKPNRVQQLQVMGPKIKLLIYKGLVSNPTCICLYALLTMSRVKEKRNSIIMLLRNY